MTILKDNNNSIAIIGAGGHGKVIGDIAHLNGTKLIHFFDDDTKVLNKKYPYHIEGDCNVLLKKIKFYKNFFVSIGDNSARSEKIKWLLKLKANIINLIHPNSNISRFVKFGKGICVMPNTVINSGCVIKDGVIINSSATIEHDTTIKNYSHICPGVTISGHVKIGSFCLLGSGTSIHPLISIGNNVKVGVGSKIFRDILNNEIHKE